jgi:hypothetical protein
MTKANTPLTLMFFASTVPLSFIATSQRERERARPGIEAAPDVIAAIGLKFLEDKKPDPVQ